MAFQQLYYTSCERGLSGFAGYQFNAVTPGVHPEAMREVENLTAYEAPRSLPHAPTEGEIAACPVNLCFSPGVTTIVANVVFTGVDFSRRLGNYFAHAIITTAPEADLSPLLPIELWQAPHWSRRTVDALELPELRGPLSRGPLDHATVEAFVDAHPTAYQLPMLLSAVGRAVMTGERSVVLVEPDVEASAQWIAAVSYLLPPPFARAMSFATYHHRPSYCRLHVIGTIPDADVDASDAALGNFYLFDFPAGRSTNLAVHPLAELLTRIGITAAEALWERTASLVEGTEATFDDWYPVAAVAAALQGVQLACAELDATIEWLPTAARRLRAETVTSICTALLDQTEFDPQHLPALLTGAGAAGASAMLDELERRLVDAELAEVLRDSALNEADRPRRVVSEAVRVHAQQRCEQELEHADSSTAIRVLSWAMSVGVPLSNAALERFLVHSARQDPSRRIELLRRILDVREDATGALGVADDRLLEELWPEHIWTVTEALALFGVLSANHFQAGEIPTWLTCTLLQGPRQEDDRDLEDYTLLCRRLKQHPSYAALLEDGQRCIQWMDHIDGELAWIMGRSGDEVVPVVQQLIAQFPNAPAPAQQFLLQRLPAVLAVVPPEHFADVLASCPEPLWQRFLEYVRPRLRPDQPVLGLGVAMVIVMIQLRRKGHSYGQQLEEQLLADTLPSWKRRDLDKLEDWLARVKVEWALEFMEWREQCGGKNRGRRGRLWQRRVGE